MQAYIFGPYLSHIKRDTCNSKSPLGPRGVGVKKKVKSIKYYLFEWTLKAKEKNYVLEMIIFY